MNVVAAHRCPSKAAIARPPDAHRRSIAVAIKTTHHRRLVPLRAFSFAGSAIPCCIVQRMCPVFSAPLRRLHDCLTTFREFDAIWTVPAQLSLMFALSLSAARSENG